MQKNTYTWQKDDRFSVTTDIYGIDLYKLAGLIKEHDWTVCDRPVDMTVEAIRNSETFICLDGRTPIGFMRMVTDYVTMAYVTDVNISSEYQGMGLSVFMLDCVFKKHPVFRKMRRVNLITPNASGLYAKYGFRPASHPEEYMERNTSYEEAYADYFDRKRTNI